MKKLMLVISFMLISWQIPTVVHAEQESGISVSLEQPAAQRDDAKLVSYADLMTKPGDHTTLTFDVKNQASHDITVDVSAGTATTSANGAVIYSTRNWPDSRFAGMQARMEQYLTPSDTKIIVPAGETKRTTVSVTTHDNGISGVMAGGVSFTAEGQDDVNSQNATMNFNTEVGYTIAVLNRTSNNILVPNLSIGTATAKVFAHEAAINMKLINNTQTFLNSLYMRVSIVGPRGTYLQREDENMQMAPNSQFNYKVWAGKQDLPAGNYTVTAVGYYGREDGLRYDAPNGKRYAYRTFSKTNVYISDKTAQKLNNQNAMLRKSIFWQPLFWMTIGVAVALILFFIWMLTRRRRVHYKFMLADGKIIARGHVHLRSKGHATINMPVGYVLVADTQDFSSGQIALKGTKLQNDFVVREG